METKPKDILVPLQTEEKELAPYPAIEYDVLMHTNLDKLIRDVNNRLGQGRQTEGGIQVSNGPIITYYQALIRWNVDADYNPTVLNDNQYINGTNDEDNITGQKDVGKLGGGAQPMKEV